MLWSTCAPPGHASSTPQPVCTLGETRSCDAGGGAPGSESCVLDGAGSTIWGNCTCDSCDDAGTYGTGSGGGTTPGSSSTPLVLSFTNARVELTADSAHTFPLWTSLSAQTDWPTAATPWLALDRDGNGSIDDGGELFGSAVALAGGGYAENGFEALRDLDSNGDGRISPSDETWPRLLVWSDRDGDRRSSASELASLASLHVVSIDLGYRIDPVCDARGNCEVEHASFLYSDSSGVVKGGTVVDVHVRAQ
jgi:hypothetical protein